MLRSSILSLAGALACGLVPVAAQAQSQPADLPDGAGKEVVEAVCTTCHETNQITRSSGYTEDGWRELIGTMIDLSGSPEQQDGIIAIPRGAFPAEPSAGRPGWCRARPRSRSRNGRCRRSASARAIRSRRRTAPSGGPGSGAT